MQPSGLPHPGEYLRLCPLLHNRCTGPKKYGPNERTDQSSRKNTTKQREIVNLSDAQFKTLVIRTFTEVVEHDHKIEEEVKAMLKETKENVQGTNSGGKETGTQINSLDHKEEINIPTQ